MDSVDICLAIFWEIEPGRRNEQQYVLIYQYVGHILRVVPIYNSEYIIFYMYAKHLTL